MSAPSIKFDCCKIAAKIQTENILIFAQPNKRNGAQDKISVFTMLFVHQNQTRTRIIGGSMAMDPAFFDMEQTQNGESDLLSDVNTFSLELCK